MRNPAFWRIAVVAVLMGAIAVAPSFALAQSSMVQVTIDTPTASSTVANGDVVDFGGWAVDNSAVGGTGIDEVDIYVDVQNGVAGQKIAANYGTYRPDVARTFGRSDWVNSGFNLNWTVSGLSDGQHTFQVWAHSATNGWHSGNVTLAVSGTRTTASPPSVQVSVPPAQPLGVIQPGQPPLVMEPPMVPPMAQPIPPIPPNAPVVACNGGPTMAMMGMLVLPC
jgi:Bacterial Ig domain